MCVSGACNKYSDNTCFDQSASSESCEDNYNYSIKIGDTLCDHDKFKRNHKFNYHE